MTYLRTAKILDELRSGIQEMKNLHEQALKDLDFGNRWWDEGYVAACGHILRLIDEITPDVN